MKVHYKGVLCNLATYRVMGEDKPALYYIDSPDQETMLKSLRKESKVVQTKKQY